MDARPIGIGDVRADFLGEDLFPCAALGGACAVADTLTADDQHPRLRAAFQQFGQGAHKGVIAAIGFEVAINEGDDFVVFGEGLTVETQAHVGIGGNGLGVDAVMNHGNTVAGKVLACQ